MGQSYTRPVKPWADGPLQLIQTPRARAGLTDLSKEHPASAAATQMALVHNVLIRGINSMYLQAPLLNADRQAADVADFMIMVRSWIAYVHDHHDAEETSFFPWIEDDLGVPHGAVLGGNIAQHHLFQAHMKAFEQYVDQVVAKEARYDADKLCTLLDAFVKGEEGLYKHLNEEIPTFEALEKYGDQINWKRWNQRLEQKVKKDIDMEYALPVAICNMDREFEGGIHKSTWPPLPWFVLFFMRWFKIPKHQGAWRFCSCDSLGRPKELAFTIEAPGELKTVR